MEERGLSRPWEDAGGQRGVEEAEEGGLLVRGVSQVQKHKGIADGSQHVELPLGTRGSLCSGWAEAGDGAGDRPRPTTSGTGTVQRAVDLVLEAMCDQERI